MDFTHLEHLVFGRPVVLSECDYLRLNHPLAADAGELARILGRTDVMDLRAWGKGTIRHGSLTADLLSGVWRVHSKTPSSRDLSQLVVIVNWRQAAEFQIAGIDSSSIVQIRCLPTLEEVMESVALMKIKTLPLIKIAEDLSAFRGVYAAVTSLGWDFHDSSSVAAYLTGLRTALRKSGQLPRV